jgi:hypothetical protein
MNLLEHQAASEKNQSCGMTLLNFAVEKDLGVLTNRPLNAFNQNKLVRLVSLLVSENFSQSKLQKDFEQLASLEQDFTNRVMAKLKTDESTIQELIGYFSSGSYLQVNYHKLGPYWTWIESQAHFLAEQISYAVQKVNDLPDKDNDTTEWLDNYVSAFNNVLDNLTLYYGQQTANLNQEILSALKKNFTPFNSFNNLHHLAIHTLRATKGVSSVLVGMRQTDYVDNVLEELKFAIDKEIKTDDWQKISEVLSQI